MMNYFHSSRTVLVSAVIAFSFAIGAGAPGLAQAAADKVEDQVKRVDKEQRKKIRAANDLKLKSREPSFPETSGSAGKEFPRDGGDCCAARRRPESPLLDAADYFEKQSEVIANSEAEKPLPEPTTSHAPGGSHSHNAC